MSASSVCSGTRPSEMVSDRLISMPPRRPPHWILAPCAPLLMELVKARFIVRRNAARLASCSAMDSATSAAFSSGRGTSRTFTWTFFLVRRSSSLLRASTSEPPLPITMPGRAVWMSTAISPCSAALRIRTSAIPARVSFFSMCSRILRSSPSRSAKSLSEYQLLLKSTFSPLRFTPRRKPSGCTFWPILLLVLVSGRAHGNARGRAEGDAYVAGALADHGRPAHGSRAEPLDGRPLIDPDVPDDERVYVGVVVVLGVGGGALYDVADDARGPLVGELQDGDGHVLAPVVDGDGVTDELGVDHRGPAPRLEHPLLVVLVHTEDALHQALLYERLFLR